MATRKADEQSLSAARVEEILTYDPASGLFRWKVKKGKQMPGSLAGRRSRAGYVYIGIDGARYCAHRLAWLMVTGRWPTRLVDHINGTPSDNRFSNLREATHAENSRNMKGGRPSASGLKGAIKNKSKWMARICVSGKHFHLGMFDTAEEAHEIYCEAAQRLHGTFARTS